VTIEQRVTDAILDLESLLSSGATVEAALVEASSDYGLKPEVLRVRAEAIIGNLKTFASRVEKNHRDVQKTREAQQRAVEIQAAVQQRFGNIPSRWSLADLGWFMETFSSELDARAIALGVMREKRIISA
jgi:gamma-glutamyl:cysteine ligase YbdK (ATP-grasp superfamily)